MMISTSKAGGHHNQVADETPSWDDIAYALKALLCEFDLDLSRVGAAQRLQYEDFETIFYHLFILINPSEAKRQFRLLCQARNQEEKTKFLESAVRFINDKQLHPQRVSSSQLRMFGGEPFRRLTRSLIKAASERELERHELNIEEQVELQRCNNNLEMLLDHLNEKMNCLQSTMLELNQSMEHLREARKSIEESDQDIQDKWSFMADKLVNDEYRISPTKGGDDAQSLNGGGGGACDSLSGSSLNNNPTHQRDVSPIVRLLIERLGNSHSKTKLAMERIQSIELPPEETIGSAESAVRKRLSQFIREVANKFNTSQELLPDAHQTRLNEQVRQQLIEYDTGVERLIETWRDVENRVDEELLQMAEMSKMYANLENLIPRIELPTIEPLKKGNNGIGVKMCDIENILKLFPDPRYDDKEIGEITRKHFH